jgi:hypothetical protein
MALIMPSSGRGGRISATKSDGGASASAKKYSNSMNLIYLKYIFIFNNVLKI